MGCSLACCLFLVALSSAMDPPALLWEREYFPDRTAWFDRAIEVSDGGFAVAASVGGFELGNRALLRMDSDGDILWYPENQFHAQHGKWVEELPDGGFIVSGTAQQTPGESYGILLIRVDAEGTVDWAKVYDLTNDWDIGWCVTPLPDGGFAVCGEYDQYDAFVMRTDANGDSLWMRVFDYGHLCKAYRVIYWDNGLTVFVDAFSSYGPLLLRYNLDGDLLWAQDYTGMFPGSSDAWGGDVCMSSAGGYMFVSAYLSEIGQTDLDGELLWHEVVPGASRRCGLSLQPTMDEGYIFSGWGGLFSMPALDEMSSLPVDTGSTKDGWLVKLDAEGNADWVLFNSIGSHANIFYSACQLQGGGYIVAGQYDTNGYLLCYAPETGIEEGASISTRVLLPPPVPNPSSDMITIPYEVPVTMETVLAIYDLSGRCVDTLFDGIAAAGSNEVIWDPGNTPSGCYLVVLRTEDETLYRTCLLVR